MESEAGPTLEDLSLFSSLCDSPPFLAQVTRFLLERNPKDFFATNRVTVIQIGQQIVSISFHVLAASPTTSIGDSFTFS